MLKSIAPIWQKLYHLQRPRMFMHSATDTNQPTLGQNLAEHVAGGVGSWPFIGAQAVLMALWVLINTLVLTKLIHWDEYPFVFLNLAMSAEAAFTGPILLIAANAGAVRDHKQSNRIEQLVAQNEQLEERNKMLVERLVNVEQLLEEHVRSSLELHTMELRDLKSLVQDVHSTLGCGATPAGASLAAASPAAPSSAIEAASSGLSATDPAPDSPSDSPPGQQPRSAVRPRPASGRTRRTDRG